jgi:mevalonate pyrophosphate decarboxylase
MQASGQIFKDDMNSFSSSSDICFTRMYVRILFHTKIENYLRFGSGSGQRREVGSVVLI